MLTLFAAIKLPEFILDAITPLQKGIEGVRWSPRENLHITVGYFGKVSTEYAEILDTELAQSPGYGFDLRLAGADIFANPRPNTLWLGVEKSPALIALHKYIRSAARRTRIDMETRNFKPHLSLAYLGRDVAKDDLSRYLRRYVRFKSPTFLVDEFALYASQRHKNGPQHLYQRSQLSINWLG